MRPVQAQRIHIPVGAGYDVHIGAGLRKNCAPLVKACAGEGRVAIVTDTTVEALYLRDVRAALEEAGMAVESYAFAAGEGSKNLQVLSGMLEFLAARRFTRADSILALGGGVVGDMAGFAAGCYMRGIGFIQMPTTLLAAVDASVGGKTAVNLRAGKNLAGLFVQPMAVLCDTECMESLPEAALADGLAEAIKTAVLFDEELFSILEKGNARENMHTLIAACVAHKGRIVAADTFERGERKLLNLGHTAGHAVEKLSGFAISHGHAVSMGMALMAGYAQREGLCGRDAFLRILRALERNGLPLRAPYSAAQMAEAVWADKKRERENVTLILPERIGACMLRETDMHGLRDVFQSGMEALACLP